VVDATDRKENYLKKVKTFGREENKPHHHTKVTNA
jgi:hypothetical protein